MGRPVVSNFPQPIRLPALRSSRTPSAQAHFTFIAAVLEGGDFSDDESLGVLGVRYVLPFYLESELRLDNDGKFRLEIGSEIQLMPVCFSSGF